MLKESCWLKEVGKHWLRRKGGPKRERQSREGRQKTSEKESGSDVTRQYHSTSYFLRVPGYDTTGNLQRENEPPAASPVSRPFFQKSARAVCPASPGNWEHITPVDVSGDDRDRSR